MANYNGTIYSASFSSAFTSASSGGDWQSGSVYTPSYGAMFTSASSGGSFIATLSYFRGKERYLNRVYDSVQSGTVYWSSHEPDKAGYRYPGPGIFGTDTSQYVTIVLTSE